MVGPIFARATPVISIITIANIVIIMDNAKFLVEKCMSHFNRHVDSLPDLIEAGTSLLVNVQVPSPSSGAVRW